MRDLAEAFRHDGLELVFHVRQQSAVPPQGIVETVDVAFVEGVLLDQAPVGSVGPCLIIPLVVHKRAGLLRLQTAVRVVVIVGYRPLAGRRGRGIKRIGKVFLELPQQRVGAEWLASLSGVRCQFDVDGHVERWCFRLFGWLRQHFPRLFARGVKSKKRGLACAAIRNRVRCLVIAAAFLQQAGQYVTRAHGSLGRVLRGSVRVMQSMNGLPDLSEDPFVTFGYGVVCEGTKPHTDQKFQNDGHRRCRFKASAAAQRFCLGAPQCLPQPRVGKRHAGVQAPFFQHPEQVVSQARLFNPAAVFDDGRAAKLQMGDLVG